MSGWHNVWVAKCLGVKMSLVVIMSGCPKGGCQSVLVSKYPVPKCRRIVTVTVTVDVHGGLLASVAQPQKGPQQAVDIPCPDHPGRGEGCLE